MKSDMTATTDWDAFNAGVVEDFRAHQGTITAGRFAGRKLMLLTTTGARSGQERAERVKFALAGKFIDTGIDFSKRIERKVIFCH